MEEKGEIFVRIVQSYSATPINDWIYVLLVNRNPPVKNVPFIVTKKR